MLYVDGGTQWLPLSAAINNPKVCASVALGRVLYSMLRSAAATNIIAFLPSAQTAEVHVAEPAQRAAAAAPHGARPAPRLAACRAIEADLGAWGQIREPWPGWRRPRPACGRRASFLNIHV